MCAVVHWGAILNNHPCNVLHSYKVIFSHRIEGNSLLTTCCHQEKKKSQILELSSKQAVKEIFFIASLTQYIKR